MAYNLEYIEKYMKENNLTKTGFCKVCGFSYGVLQKILNQNTNIRSRYIVKIVKVLNIKVSDFMY